MPHNDTPEIDFVIPWVDGSDPAWLEERRHYDSKTGDIRDARYRDWGLMPYWFRAIEKYTPWVRKIHFITWGHIPGWLDTNNPKLHIVRHEDYIPRDYLPTFQANTIELNVHRIDDLAEHFVYFNDDMFLTRTVSPDYFFREGLPCDCFSLQSIAFFPNSIGWMNGSDISIINKHFPLRQTIKVQWRKALHPKNGIKKVSKTLLHTLCHPWFPGMYYSHVAAPYLKSTLNTLWNLEPEILDETCKCRFREQTNVNQYLFKFWQLATGAFYPAPVNSTHCFHMYESWTPQICRAITNKQYASICINDIGVIEDITWSALQIKSAFETVLPDKCSFEK